MNHMEKFLYSQLYFPEESNFCKTAPLSWFAPLRAIFYMDSPISCGTIDLTTAGHKKNG